MVKSNVKLQKGDPNSIKVSEDFDMSGKSKQNSHHCFSFSVVLEDLLLLGLPGKTDTLGATFIGKRQLGNRPREVKVVGRMKADWKVI